MTDYSPTISFKSATKKFGRFKAIEDVTFDVLPGEIVGFVGMNGAGKTTTINMLLGFTSPSKGTVSVFGEHITTSNVHLAHRRIGYAAGDMELPIRMTGKQYLDFVLAQSTKSHTKQLDFLLKQFEPQLNKKIGTLSRGNKQKIALVAAFVTEPDLVVLDEPTSGLDPIMQDVFLELIQRERIKGTTVFMSSHYLQEVAEVCTRVLLMKDGRIVEDLSERKLAEASGKAVRIVTEGELKLPKTPKLTMRNFRQESNGYHYQVTTFVYPGEVGQLTQWIGKLKDIVDVEINERTLEAEFRNLYIDAEEEEL